MPGLPRRAIGSNEREGRFRRSFVDRLLQALQDRESCRANKLRFDQVRVSKATSLIAMELDLMMRGLDPEGPSASEARAVANNDIVETLRPSAS
ncbi:hypothetical protein [Aminobacter sp. AP02]|uniref:hypothetical protein n=1 Tax=Aminobacter sp. AP02 TaxID=2135737 RepID=UPI0013048C59|nr:hypothetical protein [Aminobacter sp. AP02]